MIIMGFKLKKGELINYLLVSAVSILIFWLLQSSVLLINPCSIKSSIQSLSPLKLIWKFSIRILNPHYTQSSHLRLCTCKYLSDCHQDCTISIVYLWLIKSFKAERWRVSCPGSSYQHPSEDHWAMWIMPRFLSRWCDERMYTFQC